MGSEHLWDANGAAAELLGAIGVIASLIYVARQVRSSQVAAADTNRLTRAEGVRDMLHSYAINDELRNSLIKANRLEPFYEKMAVDLGVSFDDAACSDFASAYWFWLHWANYASTIGQHDLKELKKVMQSYVDLPSMNYAWNHSYVAKPMLDDDFIDFVEGVIGVYKMKAETNAFPADLAERGA